MKKAALATTGVRELRLGASVVVAAETDLSALPSVMSSV